MKNSKFQKVLIANLIFFLLMNLFSSCRSDELPESMDSPSIQQTENITKQITLTDTENLTEVQLLIKSTDADALDQAIQQIEIEPIFEMQNRKAKESSGLTESETRAKSPYTGKIMLEILHADLPENALGYKVKINGSSGAEKMGTWLYTIASPNWRQSSINVYDGGVVTWNEFSTCDDTDSYTLNSPEYQLEANGTLTFPLAPQNVGYNRVSVEYEPGVDLYEIYFEIRGDCSGLEACGPIETNEEQPVCCGLVNESPISTKTMQQISVFSRDELKNATMEATSLILKNRKALDRLVNEDPEIYEAIDLFFQQNSSLFMNGFANDDTIVREKHTQPALDLLQLFEHKITDQELKNYLQRLQGIVRKMEGEEFKTALKSLEK